MRGMPRPAKVAPPSLRIVFGKNVVYARIHAGFSQDGLAGRIGFDRTILGSLERGERNISIDNIERISSALEIPAHEMLDPDLAERRGFDTTLARVPRSQRRLYTSERKAASK